MLPTTTKSEPNREGRQRLMEKRETEPSKRLGLSKMGGDEGVSGTQHDAILRGQLRGKPQHSLLILFHDASR
jgi:hypothetical protein